MSKQWRGLHNPDRHERNGLAAWCNNEEITCGEHYPCRCCLMEERTILTTANEALRAQIQRLSDTRHGSGLYPWHCPACEELHRALHGGDNG